MRHSFTTTSLILGLIVAVTAAPTPDTSVVAPTTISSEAATDATIIAAESQALIDAQDAAAAAGVKVQEAIAAVVAANLDPTNPGAIAAAEHADVAASINVATANIDVLTAQAGVVQAAIDGGDVTGASLIDAHNQVTIFDLTSAVYAAEAEVFQAGQEKVSAEYALTVAGGDTTATEASAAARVRIDLADRLINTKQAALYTAQDVLFKTAIDFAPNATVAAELQAKDDLVLEQITALVNEAKDLIIATEADTGDQRDVILANDPTVTTKADAIALVTQNKLDLERAKAQSTSDNLDIIQMKADLVAAELATPDYNSTAAQEVLDALAEIQKVEAHTVDLAQADYDKAIKVKAAEDMTGDYTEASAIFKAKAKSSFNFATLFKTVAVVAKHAKTVVSAISTGNYENILEATGGLIGDVADVAFAENAEDGAQAEEDAAAAAAE